MTQLYWRGIFEPGIGFFGYRSRRGSLLRKVSCGYVEMDSLLSWVICARLTTSQTKIRFLRKHNIGFPKVAPCLEVKNMLEIMLKLDPKANIPTYCKVDRNGEWTKHHKQKIHYFCRSPY